MSIKLNIANPTSFSAHRAGWGYAMNFLMKYHDNRGILLDDFLDITFGYNYEQNKIDKKIPYRKPWIGFLHHPPSICPWYDEKYKNSIDINLFLQTEEFQISAKYCQCIFVLSNYLKEYLLENFECFKKIPIIVVKHPTDTQIYKWDFKKFKALYSISGLKLISIGYFLRNLTSLFLIESNKNLEKIILPSHLPLALDNLSREIAFKKLQPKIDPKSVKIIDWQNHEFYDKILEQSLVFLDLFDTSCNNAIIESLVRSSPMLINRHPAVEEYLGKKYPLYYKNISDINEDSDLISYDSIQTTAEYLSGLDHKQLTGEYFADYVSNSLLDLGIGSTKTKEYNRTHHKIKPQSYCIKNKTTDFDHRFGWQWVMEKVGESFIDQNCNKQTPSLYINDFAEHIFKIDNDNQIKEIVIDDAKHRVIRGYNLFSYKNSDLVNINNKYYLWHNNNNRWVEYPASDLLTSDLEYLKISTYKNNDWVAFFHNPPKMPKWFDYGQNFENMLKRNIDTIVSLHNCKKIFVLSDYLAPHIEKSIAKYNLSIPVVALKHPIPLSISEERMFNYDKFIDRPRVVQLGYWMRKMHSFWQLNCDMEKIWLYGHIFASTMLTAEKKHEKDYKDILSVKDLSKISKGMISGLTITVKDVTIARVDNDEYDAMLSSAISYVNLYDTSANNSVIECIASATPILINRLSAVQEYLGKKYPLYFDDITHANKILKDNKRILDAHEYLKNNTDIVNQLSIDIFIAKIRSEIKKLCKR